MKNRTVHRYPKRVGRGLPNPRKITTYAAADMPFIILCPSWKMPFPSSSSISPPCPTGLSFLSSKVSLCWFNKLVLQVNRLVCELSASQKVRRTCTELVIVLTRTTSLWFGLLCISYSPGPLCHRTLARKHAFSSGKLECLFCELLTLGTGMALDDGCLSRKPFWLQSLLVPSSFSYST